MVSLNDLPLLHLVPDCFVIENKLVRLQHHTLKLYSDAEGIKLLKNEWSIHDPKGCYVAALDESRSLALLGSGPEPERSISHANENDSVDYTVEPCDTTDSRFLDTESPT